MKIFAAQERNSKLHSLLQSPSLNIEEIIDAVGKDPQLSASVLSVVNSPLFGLEGKVTSIRKAVDLLGIGQLNDILLMGPATVVLNASAKQPRLPARSFVPAEKCMA